MNCIRFKTNSITTSFRDINFKNYHRSYLAPTRTNIIGLITNISSGSEKDYHKNLQGDIEISVVIENLEGELNDLWAYKTFKNSNHGRSIIKRVKNYKPSYTIYIKSHNDKLIRDMLNRLKYPERIPNLGMDDDLVSIQDIKIIDLEYKEVNTIHSTFPFESDYLSEYFVDAVVSPNKTIINPIDNYVYSSFDASMENMRSLRIGEKPKYIKEFFNCHIKFNSNITAYADNELKYNLLFQ